ncbi:MAG: DMT family transporter [Pseudomonadota bacterium]|nr:DMT family transporter [Pseudomonadota bacterium]
MATRHPTSNASGNSGTGSSNSGFLYAVAGFVLLSIGDAVIKSMADDWPAVAVAALRFSIGALGLSVILWRTEGATAFVPTNPWLQLARGICLAFASLAFFSAIYIMPLAEAMAIAFLAPILTQIFAGLLLGEKVPAKVYAVSLIALAGVAIILRPNLALLGWGAVLPLVSAVFFSLLMVSNRASAGQSSSLAAQVFVAGCAAPILVLGAIAANFSGFEQLDFGWPDWDVVARCALVAVTASTAHWLAYIGTSKAGAAKVAPAIYVQIVVASLLGWLFFDNTPDIWTIIGAGLIIAAGLYLWRDGQKSAP